MWVVVGAEASLMVCVAAVIGGAVTVPNTVVVVGGTVAAKMVD